MAADFVPLTATLAARNSSSAASDGFTPLLGTPASPPPQPHCASEPRELKVEVKRDGQKVTRIIIHCRCGEVIELDCE